MSKEPLLSFECVRPIESHAKLIMQWRNDPESLRQSFHSTPKNLETFYPEFLRDYFLFPDIPPLFAIHSDEKIAFLRFRPIPNPTGSYRRCCDISIIVAPEYRGRGLGTAILEQVKRWLAQQQIDDLYAEVKKDNTISQKVFEHAKFIKLHDDIKMVEDTGESCPICRYFAELSPEDLIKEHVFIIAEAGSNWRMGTPEHDLIMAKTLIVEAAEAGADAIKFQVFRPETIYVQNAGAANYLAEAGIQQEMQALFTDLAMPYEFIPQLAECAVHMGIEFMATSFSPQDFKAIDPFVKRHKIASFEIGHIHLIECAARSGKPLILSTGAATEYEIDWAVQTFKKHGGKDLTLLQCTACYPAEVESMHLRSISWLQQRFKTRVGLSDHSRHPTCAPAASVALGAKVIEKHFTLDNHLPGPDNAFAVTPSELKELVQAVRRTELMLGSPIKIIDPSEEELRSFARRGIQALKEIKKGDSFHEGQNIAILRPGRQPLGLHPRYIVDIEGKRATRSIATGRGIQRGDWN